MRDIKSCLALIESVDKWNTSVSQSEYMIRLVILVSLDGEREQPYEKCKKHKTKKIPFKFEFDHCLPVYFINKLASSVDAIAISNLKLSMTHSLTNPLIDRGRC